MKMTASTKPCQICVTAFLIALCIIPLPTFAVDYFISTTGNNTNNGTSASTPKLTLANVFSSYNLGAGDVIYIAAGTYTEKGIAVGGDDENFTIQGASSSTTLFDSDQTDRWLTIGNAVNDGITIRDLTIKDYKSTSSNHGGGIYCINGADNLGFTNIIFDNCDSGGNGGGLYFHGNSNINITSCRFSNCAAGSMYGGAIALLNTTSTITISKSIFNNNSADYGSAIELEAGSSGTMQITNSLFYANQTGTQGVIGLYQGTSTITNCTIVNNTNSSSSSTGGVYNWGSSTATIRNTIAYNNTSLDFNDPGNLTLINCSYTSSSSISSINTNTSPVTGDPLFTNAGSNDFTLQAGSNCINAGTSTNAPSDDLNGTSRPQGAGIDIGCYERLTPNITTTGTLSAFSTCSGLNATAQSFTVSGTALTENISITPPSGFELSSTSSSSGFSTSAITLTQSSGTVSTTTIWVRTTTTASGTPSGNITCISAGATQRNVSASATISNPMSTTPANGDIVWVGTTTSWTSTSNWLTHNGTSYNIASASPSSSNRVIIGNPSCSSAQPTLAANANTGSLIIESGATLNQSSHTLTINGSFTNNGTFTAGTGTTIITNTGSINGSSTFYNLTINATGNTITLGANQTISNNLTISAGTLDVSSSNFNLQIGNRFTNNGSFNARSSTFTFNGSSAQQIDGANDPNFNSITINNSAGVVLGRNTTVRNTLTLTNGKLTVQGYTLTLGTSSSNATISGASTSRYIVAYDNNGTIGKIKQFINSAESTSYSFPVGDVTNYTPLTYTQTGGTVGSGAFLEVYTKPSKITGLNAAFSTYINRYWDVTSSGMTNPIYNISYSYVDGDVVGTEADIFPVKLSGTTWYKPSGTVFTTGTSMGTGSTNASSNTLTWTGLNSFSKFGGVGNNATPLPVTLISFQANCSNQVIDVHWSTSSEHNSSHYTLEHSKDGAHWKTVASIDGAGQTQHQIDYSLIDHHPYTGLNYYRLLQYDLHGSHETFGPISIACEDIIGERIYIYPNPIRDKFTITGSDLGIYSDFASLEIYDQYGKLVYDEFIPIENETVNHLISNFDLTSGVYVVFLKSGDTKSSIQKIIIE